ncbi:hypothetical protein AMECASPLE_017333 [Ameca splendens]|uniref:Uncharacterized protein n=1 Tax=Ameca splendens TaxID=208324 RepID=A0ABV1A8V4_9TELE
MCLQGGNIGSFRIVTPCKIKVIVVDDASQRGKKEGQCVQHVRGHIPKVALQDLPSFFSSSFSSSPSKSPGFSTVDSSQPPQANRCPRSGAQTQAGQRGGRRRSEHMNDCSLEYFASLSSHRRT